MGWVDVDFVEGKECYGFVVMVGFGIDVYMIVEIDDDFKDKVGWFVYVELLGCVFVVSDVVFFYIIVDDQFVCDEEGYIFFIVNCGMF